MLSFAQAIFKSLIFFFAVGFVLVYSDNVVISEDFSGQSLVADLQEPALVPGEQGNRQKRAEIQDQLRTRRKEFERVSRAERDIIADLDQIDAELSSARRRAAALQAEIEDSKQSIHIAQQELAQLKAELAEAERYATKRLVALYKLSWLGQINVLASADSTHEFLRRKSALQAILDHDQKVIQRLIASQQRVVEVKRHLDQEHSRKLVLEEELREEAKRAIARRHEKKELLEMVGARKSLQLAAIQALEESARELDQAIASMNSGQADPGRPSPGKNFSTYKGLLEMPVKGEILHRFGKYRNPEFDVVNFRSGIDIKAEKGDPVQAVCDGQVLFASWLKGYGNMIIIEHGDSYYTVYAHVQEIFKQKGDMVETGEVIATVGDTGALDGIAKLHFEIRHHGNPMDPLPWLK